MYLKLILLVTLSNAVTNCSLEEEKQKSPRSALFQRSQALAIPKNKKNREPMQLDNSPFSESPNLLTFCTYGAMLGNSPLKTDNSPNTLMH